MLFETAYVCEVCRLYVEDLDLRLDEHVRVHGKGDSVRTVLLDDRGCVTLLKLHLACAGYTAGPLFRASINGRGGPPSYDAAHHRRQTRPGDADRARHRHRWRARLRSKVTGAALAEQTRLAVAGLLIAASGGHVGLHRRRGARAALASACGCGGTADDAEHRSDLGG
ncbi:Integrase/recombinase xerD [[Actinomadura] parvosata subsp. kistnae]|uniref:Uncharacterized protein n=1 Tax=[Actinomadura] parvosata subsp. kistnae TaxID=1909395 RepID=A0A1U9ZWX1_9ACTN|nr:hypothetical protein [Nonomuraea sp. ATCC 55076]AQZ62445.1 hypothetical protein BKM31_14130 [Nonomuraea sp. ATCC 55076]SPL88679.1 Integrase/recombinase xerD [Actinomadura parvosata subsp. kistnae]